jgi:hypothetical protein
MSEEPLGEWREMIQSLKRVIRSLSKTIAAAEAESWPEEKDHGTEARAAAHTGATAGGV